MEIYGEYFFIENFIADGVIAALTLNLWRRKIFTVNYFTAVFLMTLYSFFIFSPCSSVAYSVPAKLLFSIMIVKILFYESDLRTFVQGGITFIGVCMVMGGAVSFTVYLLKSEGLSSSGVIYVSPGSYPAVICSICLSYLFIRIFLGFLTEKRKKENMIVGLKVKIADSEFCLKAVVDTGNFLRDPVENMPVLLAEADSLRPALKELIGKAKLRVIPYSSVGTESGTLMGIKIDRITIIEENREYEGKSGVMAVYNGSFGLENGCNAILHPEILEKEAADYAAWKNL